MTKAQLLIDRLLAAPGGPEVGKIANELLAEFWHGYPLSALRELLHDEYQDVFGAALFILSELADKGRPLLDELPRLLTHPWAHARVEAVESAMTATEDVPEDAAVVAATVMLVDDVERPVRTVTRHFLLVSSETKLTLALKYMDAASPNDGHTTGLRWLLSSSARNPADVTARFEDSRRTLRHFALGAAMRMAASDRTPLDRALASGDAEIREDAVGARRTIQLMERVTRLRAGGR